MTRIFAFLAALALAVGLAWATAGPPSPRPANDPDAFSALTAMADVRVMGREFHPTGTPANGEVRDYLVGRLEGLGLQVSLQPGRPLRAAGPGWAVGAAVQNIIAVLPGEDRTAPAVLLMSHYDSAVGSPGAADDAAGVAASLEAVRALIASGAPRRRDLIVLITDAEEQGLLGAQAFFADHPLRERICAVVNLETRGASGRAFMFETGQGNGAMMGVYAGAVRQPSTTSLAAFLYSILPNDTDFTHSREADLPGFNIAFIGEPFHYHSATSTPETLDQGSLQHMGGQALDLTRALLAADSLPGAAPDAVFSDIFGFATLVYPAWVGWLIVLLSGLVLTGLFLRPPPDAGARWRGLGLGFGAGVLGMAAAMGLARLVRIGTGVIDDFAEGRRLLGHLGLLEAALGLAALGAVLVIGRLLLRRRGASATDWHSPAVGLLALGWLLALVLQIIAPTAAIIAAWPTLVGALALLAWRRLGQAGLWAAAVLGVIGTGFMFGLAHGIFLGVGWTWPEAVAALGVLVLLPLAPLIGPALTARRGLALGLAFILAAGVLTAAIRLAPQATLERPGFNHVIYVAEPETGEFRMISSFSRLDDWSRGVLASGGGEIRQAAEPALWMDPAFVAPAPRIEAPSPTVDVSVSPDGAVVVRVEAPPEARELRLSLAGPGRVSDIQVEGAAVEPPAEGEPVRIRWADPAGGVTLTFRIEGETTLYWAALTDGWPQGAPDLPRRAPEFVPWGASDSLAVVGQREIRRPDSAGSGS